MSLIVKGVLDVSCSIFNAILHIILRDLTDYYWYNDDSESQVNFHEEDLLENVGITECDVPVCLVDGEIEDEAITCENLNISENTNEPITNSNDEISNNHDCVIEKTDNETLNNLDSPKLENCTLSETENLGIYYEESRTNFKEVSQDQSGLYFNIGDISVEIIDPIIPNTCNVQSYIEEINVESSKELPQDVFYAEFKTDNENTNTLLLNTDNAYFQNERPNEEISDNISQDACEATMEEGNEMSLMEITKIINETKQKITEATTCNTNSLEKEKTDEESVCELCIQNFGQLSDGEGFDYLKLKTSTPREPSADEKQKKPKFKAKSKISRYLGRTPKQQIKNKSLKTHDEMENQQSLNVLDKSEAKRTSNIQNENVSLQLPNLQDEQKLLMLSDVVENFKKLETFLESSEGKLDKYLENLEPIDNIGDNESACSGDSWIGRFLSAAKPTITNDCVKPKPPVQNETKISSLQEEENNADLCECTKSHCCLLDVYSDGEDLTADILTTDELKSVETGSDFKKKV